MLWYQLLFENRFFLEEQEDAREHVSGGMCLCILFCVRLHCIQTGFSWLLNVIPTADTPLEDVKWPCHCVLVTIPKAKVLGGWIHNLLL